MSGKGSAAGGSPRAANPIAARKGDKRMRVEECRAGVMRSASELYELLSNDLMRAVCIIIKPRSLDHVSFRSLALFFPLCVVRLLMCAPR